MNAGSTNFIKIQHHHKLDSVPLHKINAKPSGKTYSMQIIPRYKH